MLESIKIFEDAKQWLVEHYTDYHFFTERDLVWILQNRLLDNIKKEALPYRVFYNFEMYPENKGRKKKQQCQDDEKQERTTMSADLAIMNNANIVEVAVEFKYEPSHLRSYDPQLSRSHRKQKKATIPPDCFINSVAELPSIWHGKFPVAFWFARSAGKSGSIEKDLERVKKCVEDYKAGFAYTNFIDEGGYYRYNKGYEPFPGSNWKDLRVSDAPFRCISVL